MWIFGHRRTGHLCRWGLWIPLIALALSTSVRAGAPGTAREDPASAPPLDRAERETFLLEGAVVRDRSAGGGITLPRRVTLRKSRLEHDALVQTHDEYRARHTVGNTVEIDFRDSWRNNVAAYRLDKLLGLGFVPVTVVRDYQRQPAAWTWWVDDVLMSERERLEQKRRPLRPLDWVGQMHVVRVFDQLIYNFDRTAENLLIDGDWHLWMIDHTRAFKVFGELRKEENLPSRCERHLLSGLRSLDRPLLDTTMEGLLDGRQIDGLLARRDAIVRFYDDAITTRGEPAVLYDLPSRLAPAPGGPEGATSPR